MTVGLSEGSLVGGPHDIALTVTIKRVKIANRVNILRISITPFYFVASYLIEFFGNSLEEIGCLVIYCRDFS